MRHLGLVHYDAAYGLSEADVLAAVRRGGYEGEARVLRDMDVLAGDDRCS